MKGAGIRLNAEDVGFRFLRQYMVGLRSLHKSQAGYREIDSGGNPN